MDKISTKADVLLVVEDFNVWIEMKDNLDSHKLLTLMNAHGHTQLEDQPTSCIIQEIERC